MTSTFRPDLPALTTIVVKVGSRLVSGRHDGDLDARVGALVDDIAALRHQGLRVILVSSGAIAHGMAGLGLSAKPTTLPMKQACASIGQSRLMAMYAEQFGRHGIVVGQVLLTWADLRDKRRYLNLRNTLFQLLESGAVPIINENDSVSVEEIELGNNDTLGAQIALLTSAGLYVILTDVAGLYRANPKVDPRAEHIPLVTNITPEILAMAGDAGSAVSVGGMATKLRAADMVTRAGLCTLISDGYGGRLLDALTRPDAGTLFTPSPRRMSSRRRWIAFTRHASGSLIVDEGAEHALTRQGRSLLPAGVKRPDGRFGAGDMVAICSEDGRTIAHGLTNYSSDDVSKIAGCKTSEIGGLLGYKEFDEVVHRDNLVVLESPAN
jgi:glutamate 5-kinase